MADLPAVRIHQKLREVREAERSHNAPLPYERRLSSHAAGCAHVRPALRDRVSRARGAIAHLRACILSTGHTETLSEKCSAPPAAYGSAAAIYGGSPMNVRWDRWPPPTDLLLRMVMVMVMFRLLSVSVDLRLYPFLFASSIGSVLVLPVPAPTVPFHARPSWQPRMRI